MCNSICVGFARRDITPQEYVNLGGHGDDVYRICTNVLDRITTTCVAITDNRSETVLLCLVDLINATGLLVEQARAAITKCTDIPADHIIIAASHTHSGPATSFPSLDSMKVYYPYLISQMTKTAKEALADRASASIYSGSKEVKNMIFVRHYLMNDGTYAGPNFGSFKSGVKAHADMPDEQMQMIRFVREQAKDILLVNWQCHATISSTGHPAPPGMTRTELSADYVGTMRDHLEGMSGCHVAFVQGAAGNLVPASKIKEEMIVAHDHILYGRKLAEFAKELLDALTPAKDGCIHLLSEVYIGKTDHSDDHLVENARKVSDAYYQFKDAQERRAFVHSHGFNSVHHANGVIKRANLPNSHEMSLTAFSIGDIAFATAPYEMFCSNGKFIKQNSPFPTTFVMAYCNGSNSYLADEAAFRYDCYEVNARLFQKGTAEKVAAKLTQMLNEIHGQQ